MLEGFHRANKRENRHLSNSAIRAVCEHAAMPPSHITQAAIEFLAAKKKERKKRKEYLRINFIRGKRAAPEISAVYKTSLWSCILKIRATETGAQILA